MLADPGVHRDAGRDAGVDRSGRTELRDRQHRCRGLSSGLGQTRAFLAEQEHAGARQQCGLDGLRAGQVVDADDGEVVGACVVDERIDRVVIADVLIAIGDHRTAAIPSSLAHDVNLCREERVGVAHNGADVEIVLPVLDGDVKGMPLAIEVVDDGLEAPVAVAVDDVAGVAVGQELGVEAVVVGPGEGMGADRHGVMVTAQLR